MKIKMIVAVDKRNGIGIDNRLAWHVKEDLAFFKEQTLGKVCIVGRRTYDSLPDLHDRQFVVMTQHESLPVMKKKESDIIVKDGIAHTLDMLNMKGVEEVFIVGGVETYKLTSYVVDEVYLTEFDMVSKANRFLPKDFFDDFKPVKQLECKVVKDHLSNQDVLMTIKHLIRK